MPAGRIRPARAGRRVPRTRAVGRRLPARASGPARLGRCAPRTLAAEILSRARRPSPAGRIRPARAGRRVPRTSAVGRRLPARASGPARLGGRWPGGTAACGRVPVRRDVVRRRPAEVLGGACPPAPIRRGLPAEGRVPVPAGAYPSTPGARTRPGRRSPEPGRPAAAASCTRPASLGRAGVLRRAADRRSPGASGEPAVPASGDPPESAARRRARRPRLVLGRSVPEESLPCAGLAPAQGAEPVAVRRAEVLARPRGPAIALTSGAADGVSRPPREAASTLGVRGLGRTEIRSRAASPVTVGAGPAFSYGATVLGRTPRRTPAHAGRQDGPLRARRSPEPGPPGEPETSKAAAAPGS